MTNKLPLTQLSIPNPTYHRSLTAQKQLFIGPRSASSLSTRAIRTSCWTAVPTFCPLRWAVRWVFCTIGRTALLQSRRYVSRTQQISIASESTVRTKYAYWFVCQVLRCERRDQKIIRDTNYQWTIASIRHVIICGIEGHQIGLKVSVGNKRRRVYKSCGTFTCDLAITVQYARGNEYCCPN